VPRPGPGAPSTRPPSQIPWPQVPSCTPAPRCSSPPNPKPQGPHFSSSRRTGVLEGETRTCAAGGSAGGRTSRQPPPHHAQEGPRRAARPERRSLPGARVPGAWQRPRPCRRREPSPALGPLPAARCSPRPNPSHPALPRLNAHLQRPQQRAAAVERRHRALGVLELDEGDARGVGKVAQQPHARHGACAGGAGRGGARWSQGGGGGRQSEPGPQLQLRRVAARTPAGVPQAARQLRLAARQHQHQHQAPAPAACTSTSTSTSTARLRQPHCAAAHRTAARRTCARLPPPPSCLCWRRTRCASSAPGRRRCAASAPCLQARWPSWRAARAAARR
jgi:hypothetical protein